MARRLRLRVFPRAIDDVESILRYIRQDSPSASERFRLEVGHTFSILQSAPRIGRAVTEHQSDFAEVRRYFPRRFRKYIVFYAVESEQITILRVVHGAMIRVADSMPE